MNCPEHHSGTIWAQFPHLAYNIHDLDSSELHMEGARRGGGRFGRTDDRTSMLASVDSGDGDPAAGRQGPSSTLQPRVSTLGRFCVAPTRLCRRGFRLTCQPRWCPPPPKWSPSPPAPRFAKVRVSSIERESLSRRPPPSPRTPRADLTHALVSIRARVSSVRVAPERVRPIPSRRQASRPWEANSCPDPSDATLPTSARPSARRTRRPCVT